METKKTNKLVIVLVILILLLVAAVGGMIWFFTSNFFVGGNAYPKNAQFLNLREQDITVAQYEEIQAAVPACEIAWNVPFQGGKIPQDIKELTLTSLNENDLAMFSYLTDLQTVDASGCQEYGLLIKLQETYPELQILFSVGDEKLTMTTTQVTVETLSPEQATLLANLPQLKTVNAESCADYAALVALQQAKPELEMVCGVTLEGSTLTVADPDIAALNDQLSRMVDVDTVNLEFAGGEKGLEHLGALTENHTNISFHWEKEVFGMVYDNTAVELDFSGVPAESADQIKQAAAYFPAAEKVIVDNGAIDNDTMAALRDEVRSEYKLVWTVQCGELFVRTDETYFMPLKHKIFYFFDEDIVNLKYCEDMICIDVGHMSMSNADWAANMPHLKYLILGMCGNLKDISALSNCKELVFLEIYNTSIKDYTPLLECTKLEDLNAGFTYASMEPIYQMTWLKNLWFHDRMSQRYKLAEALPDTNVVILNEDSATRGGWRQLPNYYAMRDALGMHYMK